MSRWRVAARQVAHWTLPLGFQNLLRPSSGPDSLSAPASPQVDAKSNRLFKDRHQGQRCFICATGPSVKDQDLAALAGELCIGVSFFFLHPDISTIRPLYHLLAPNHPPFDFDLAARYFDGIQKNYAPTTTIFCGHRPYAFSYLNYIAQESLILPNELHFVDYSQSPTLGEANHMEEDLWDITAHPFEVRTVLYSAIQLAAYMGCDPIYLLGCDHDYLRDLGRTENHFYAEDGGNPNDAQHLNEFATERWFLEYYCRWRDYRLMQDYLRSRGRQIFNATDGGMLDVFPRVSLGDVITTAPQVPRLTDASSW